MGLTGDFTCSYGDSFRGRFDVSFRQGTVCIIIGPSGGGKTTLLRSIGFANEPDAGIISLNGKPVYDSATNLDEREYLWQKVSLVFQEFGLWPHLTAEENILMPLDLTQQGHERVEDLLTLFEISEFRSRYPYQLSVGQKQRFALARAFARQNEFLLLDEPTSALDNLQTNNVLRATMRAADDGVGIIMVTHDLGVAELLLKKVADATFLYVAEGEIAARGTFDEYENPAEGDLKRFLARDL